MDPLSDMISFLRPHDCVAAGLDAGGDWSIRFEAHAGIKCNAILKGECRLKVDGLNETIRLNEGDCFILPKGRPFLLSVQNARFGESAEIIYAPVSHGGTAVYGEGGDFFMTGSRFLMSGPTADFLLSPLPAAMIVRQGMRQESLVWSLDRIAEELRCPNPGSALSIAHLSHLVLIFVLRLYLQENPAPTQGWLAAVADRHINNALIAIHDNPARSWTVQDLASHAGLSRTAFSERFRKTVNQTPMTYLTQLRMMFAADRLCRTDAPVARIAEDVGYKSEGAFAVAFKRTMGCSPRRYAQTIARPSSWDPNF
ncbi:MAG: AraC family transcriptional regulator [Pseudomonadota bacterium]